MEQTDVGAKVIKIGRITDALTECLRLSKLVDGLGGTHTAYFEKIEQGAVVMSGDRKVGASPLYVGETKSEYICMCAADIVIVNAAVEKFDPETSILLVSNPVGISTVALIQFYGIKHIVVFTQSNMSEDQTQAAVLLRRMNGVKYHGIVTFNDLYNIIDDLP